jgi:hypothetical protein
MRRTHLIGTYALPTPQGIPNREVKREIAKGWSSADKAQQCSLAIGDMPTRAIALKVGRTEGGVRSQSVEAWSEPATHEPVAVQPALEVATHVGPSLERGTGPGLRWADNLARVRARLVRPCLRTPNSESAVEQESRGRLIAGDGGITLDTSLFLWATPNWAASGLGRTP